MRREHIVSLPVQQRDSATSPVNITQLSREMDALAFVLVDAVSLSNKSMTLAQGLSLQAGYAYFVEDPTPADEIKREFDELRAAAESTLLP